MGRGGGGISYRAKSAEQCVLVVKLSTHRKITVFNVTVEVLLKVSGRVLRKKLPIATPSGCFELSVQDTNVAVPGNRNNF